VKYRVVQLEDGRFKCQWRFLLFFWTDSMHAPSFDRAEQIRFAQPDPQPRIKAVVWP
jgi:hypothetical protein